MNKKTFSPVRPKYEQEILAEEAKTEKQSTKTTELISSETNNSSKSGTSQLSETDAFDVLHNAYWTMLFKPFKFSYSHKKTKS